MFDGCSLLTSIDVSKFNTDNVKEIDYMFYGCSQLISINVSNFNTDNIKEMEFSFMDVLI